MMIPILDPRYTCTELPRTGRLTERLCMSGVTAMRAMREMRRQLQEAKSRDLVSVRERDSHVKRAAVMDSSGRIQGHTLCGDTQAVRRPNGDNIFANCEG